MSVPIVLVKECFFSKPLEETTFNSRVTRLNKLWWCYEVAKALILLNLVVIFDNCSVISIWIWILWDNGYCCKNKFTISDLELWITLRYWNTQNFHSHKNRILRFVVVLNFDIFFVVNITWIYLMTVLILFLQSNHNVVIFSVKQIV